MIITNNISLVKPIVGPWTPTRESFAPSPSSLTKESAPVKLPQQTSDVVNISINAQQNLSGTTVSGRAAADRAVVADRAGRAEAGGAADRDAADRAEAAAAGREAPGAAVSADTNVSEGSPSDGDAGVTVYAGSPSVGDAGVTGYAGFFDFAVPPSDDRGRLLDLIA